MTTPAHHRARDRTSHRPGRGPDRSQRCNGGIAKAAPVSWALAPMRRPPADSCLAHRPAPFPQVHARVPPSPCTAWRTRARPCAAAGQRRPPPRVPSCHSAPRCCRQAVARPRRPAAVSAPPPLTEKEKKKKKKTKKREKKTKKERGRREEGGGVGKAPQKTKERNKKMQGC